MKYKNYSSNFQLVLNRISFWGIFAFVLLYIYSSTLYPGGSQANIHAEGFDWINNYWCNLMNEKGMNGMLNPARPFSILAMVLLCLSLMIFFFQFAEYFTSNLVWKRIIKIGGVLSMFFGALLFTPFHDLMILVSSFFGLFVVIGVIKEVYQSELFYYKVSGIISLLLLGLNNYIYYSQQFLEWLPLLQKITFLMVLLWIVGMNSELGTRIKGAGK